MPQPSDYISWKTLDPKEIITKITTRWVQSGKQARELPDVHHKITKWLWDVAGSDAGTGTTLQRVLWLQSAGVINFDLDKFKKEQHVSPRAKTVTIISLFQELQMQYEVHHKGIDDDLTDILRI